MKIVFPLLLAFAMLLASASAFAPTIGGAATGGSAFVVAHPRGAAGSSVTRQQQLPRTHSTARSELFMGGKMSKFGVFSPAVYAAKVVLGTEKLNKLRGKAISLHSQYIGDFCQWCGAYHLRTQLIKKAKLNGDILGFLV
jgi:hypothetical protein